MNIQEFQSKWLSAFASEIPKKDIEKYVTGRGGYIWHVFCANLLPEDSFLSGDDAREAFEKVKKEGAIYIEPFKKKLYVPSSARICKTPMRLMPSQKYTWQIKTSNGLT